MTDERMALLELIEKGADADFVREFLAFAGERMMAMEVDALTGAPAGARSAERVNHRNGYRERGWETRVGQIDPAIPKLRKGSYFPAFLEPCRTAEKALTAVIHRAPGGRAIQPWKVFAVSRPRRGSLRPWRLDPRRRRPGQGASARLLRAFPRESERWPSGRRWAARAFRRAKCRGFASNWTPRSRPS